VLTPEQRRGRAGCRYVARCITIGGKHLEIVKKYHSSYDLKSECGKYQVEVKTTKSRDWVSLTRSQKQRVKAPNSAGFYFVAVARRIARYKYKLYMFDTRTVLEHRNGGCFRWKSAKQKALLRCKIDKEGVHGLILRGGLVRTVKGTAAKH
jgi:hypothetical protein